MLSSRSKKNSNNKAKPKKQGGIESSFQLIKPGYDPLVPRIPKFKASELSRIKLTNLLQDNTTVSRKCCTTEGKELEEVLYVLTNYKNCATALVYDASDKFENADCILEDVGYDNFTTAKLEIQGAISNFNEKKEEHWELVVKRLYTKYGVNKDSLREFYDHIYGLKKPYKWSPTEFVNRVEVLLRYYVQLGGKALSKEEKIELQKKILLSGVPPEWTASWTDLCQSLDAVSLDELTRFMNEQRSKHTNLDDSSSSDDEKDSYTPQQKKSKSEATNNKHTILKSEDRCPHCSNHKHTGANCRRYNPEAPGFWGFDKYLANGQNGGRHRPHNPLPPNHSGGYGNYNFVHCVNFKGMVDTKETNAYSVVEIYHNKIWIKGRGRERAQRLAY